MYPYVFGFNHVFHVNTLRWFEVHGSQEPVRTPCSPLLLVHLFYYLKTRSHYVSLARLELTVYDRLALPET